MIKNCALLIVWRKCQSHTEVMDSTQSFPLSEEVFHLLFNSTLYRSELAMYEKAEGY